jgi:CubicO group peptidase (beta-lactamase class C family)
MDPARVARLKKLAAGWVSSGDTPSLVVLVARRSTIVLHEVFGVRRQEDTTPTLKHDSIFPLASVAKPFTAASVMCLVEDGLIGLNRPFVDYVPEWDVPGVQWLEEARVADLLCHSSGLDDLNLGAFIAEAGRKSPKIPSPAPGQHPTLSKRIHLAAGAPLAQRPGTGMLYSNFGYNLLGDIVRRVSGQPFWRFVQSRIFDPLGMYDSHFALPPEMRERRVFRAAGMPGTGPHPLHQGVDSLDFDALDIGSEGLASTAADLAAFLQMLINRGTYGDRRILSPASVATMTRPQIDESVRHVRPRINPSTGERKDLEVRAGGYGYGLYIIGPGDRFGPNGALASLSAFAHGGYGGAYIWADPEREIVGVYLSVSPRLRRNSPISNSDLFMNAVHAAIID